MTPITTLTRLLSTIQRFTDEQTDKLEDVLGFGYNPDDAYEALNQLQALRDLPEDLIERVRKYIEAVADFPILTKGGVIASIPVIGKDPIQLNANDVQRLLRAAGVFKIGAGKIRIGHPTKGVIDAAREAGLTDQNIEYAAEAGRKIAENGYAAYVKREVAIERARRDDEPRREPHPTEGDVAAAYDALKLLNEPAEESRRDIEALQEELGLSTPNKTQREVLRRIARVERQKAGDTSVPREEEQGWTTLEDGSHQHAEFGTCTMDRGHGGLHEIVPEGEPFTPFHELVKAGDDMFADKELKDWELLDTADAAVWSHEFSKRYWPHWTSLEPRELPGPNLDALMLSWFASAIETGKRVGAEKARERLIAAEEEKALRLLDAARKQAREDEREQEEAEKERVVHRLAEERRNRREAMLNELTADFSTHPLEDAVDHILDLQDAMTEQKIAPPELIGYKIVPKNAIVFDVDDVNKRVAAAMAETIESLRRMGL